MAVLRIVPPLRLRLSDNFGLRGSPYRNSRLRIINPIPLTMGKNTNTITIVGTVKNGDGIALADRTVRIFSNQAFTALLGATYTLGDGTFSVTVPGWSGCAPVAVAQGETGENAQILTKITAP